MKAIRDYEGLYIIRSNGKIESLDRLILGRDGVVYPFKGKELATCKNKQNGYLYVDLWKDNKGKKYALHRLLAEHFIPNPLGKEEVNHKDSNRENASLDNLEWVTSSENSIHSYNSGYATQKPRRTLIEEDYREIFAMFLQGKSFACILETYSISPGRLSINLRALVNKWDRLTEYEAEIQRQRENRIKINGKQYTN